MIGWPVRRRRNLTFGVNKCTLAWLGPSPDCVQADFEAFFQASLNSTADVFLVASASEVYDEQRRLAEARGRHLPPVEDGCYPNVPPSKIYTPGQLVRLEEYEEERRKFGHRSWFADLEQSCNRGASTPGLILPSQLTHGTVHAWSKGRIMLAKEIFLAHGYNMYPDKTGNPNGCRIAQCLEAMPPRLQKELLGNGWHLPLVGAWTMYCLMNCVRLNRECSIQPERCLLSKGTSNLWQQDQDLDDV